MRLVVLDIVVTPNPNAVRFILNAVVATRAREVSDRFASGSDALADELLHIPGVTSVFYLDNFLTLTKAAHEDWPAILSAAKIAINATEFVPALGLGPCPAATTTPTEHGGTTIPADVSPRGGAETPVDGLPRDATQGPSDPAAKLALIHRVLDRDVRPGLASDGGGLEVMALEGDTLKVKYAGACGSCPTSVTGTLRFIEQTLRTKVHSALKVELM